MQWAIYVSNNTFVITGSEHTQGANPKLCKLPETDQLQWAKFNWRIIFQKTKACQNMTLNLTVYR